MPIFPKETIILKPKEQKLVKIEAPFSDEISGLVIVKLIDKPTQNIMMSKVKFMRNAAILDIMNNGLEVLIINPKEALGILDLRSIGYYKIKQGELQQNLSKYYEFELAEKLCDQYNNLINTLRKEQSIDKGEKYPWLEDSNERKFMTDREILEKYINLDDTCLKEREKKEIREMLYKYKDAFSLRDEIGMCLNIEIGIDVTDKSSFLLDLIMSESKIKSYLGILKEGFLPYSSPVMSISRKLTQDKRVVTDFRHLNVRIAKNNLAYPLVQDTFSVLGNLKCEVLSVLDLKDAFHLLRLPEDSKRYCSVLPYFGSASYIYQRMPMGLNISSSIW